MSSTDESKGMALLDEFRKLNERMGVPKAHWPTKEDYCVGGTWDIAKIAEENAELRTYFVGDFDSELNKPEPKPEPAKETAMSFGVQYELPKTATKVAGEVPADLDEAKIKKMSAKKLKALIVGLGGNYEGIVEKPAMRKKALDLFAKRQSGASEAPSCHSCGAALAAPYKFCGNCGTKQEEKPARRCTKCNAELAAPYKFCGECGSKQEEQSEAAQAWEAQKTQGYMGPALPPGFGDGPEEPEAVECNWEAVVDPTSGSAYYYHVETRETSWAMPDEYAKAHNIVQAQPVQEEVAEQPAALTAPTEKMTYDIFSEDNILPESIPGRGRVRFKTVPQLLEIIPRWDKKMQLLPRHLQFLMTRDEYDTDDMDDDTAMARAAQMDGTSNVKSRDESPPDDSELMNSDALRKLAEQSKDDGLVLPFSQPPPPTSEPDDDDEDLLFGDFDEPEVQEPKPGALIQICNNVKLHAGLKGKLMKFLERKNKWGVKLDNGKRVALAAVSFVVL